MEHCIRAATFYSESQRDSRKVLIHEIKQKSEERGFYRGFLQAVQQVMVLDLKGRATGLGHQGFSCLLGGLGTHKGEKEKK